METHEAYLETVSANTWERVKKMKMMLSGEKQPFGLRRH